ncbi:MAG TPA: hypothetical protein DCQ32_07525 [Cyanobacteria bacterium UBA8156]|nr:hypothetical protein [Cyanobacteria bacterium UBA8156]
MRPLLPSNLANWSVGAPPRPRPRWVWPLGTLALLALLGDPQLSLALAVGGGLFWWRRQGRRGGSPTGWMVGTVGLTTAAMVGTYGLLHTGNLGWTLQTLALAIALWRGWPQGRPRRSTPKQAWTKAIAQLTHPDDRVRAIALQRLTRWALRGLTPSQNQELAGYCRLLLARESSPALREAVLLLAAAVDEEPRLIR